MPTSAQRMPVFGRPPVPGRGQAVRTIDAREREDRDEARLRATISMPWGTRIVGHMIRTSPTHWSCLIRETDAEREVRLRARDERRAMRSEP